MSNNYNQRNRIVRDDGVVLRSNEQELNWADIITFPDSTGTPQIAADNPGGFQLGFTAYYVAGQGNTTRQTSINGIRKRPISNGDYVIFLAKTSTGMDITINYETEQQY